MKKSQHPEVLIYMQTSELGPVGGSRGYVFNLHRQIEADGIQNIHFIESGRETINKYKNKIESMNPGASKKVLQIVKSIIKYLMLLWGPRHRALVDLSDYDMVHFHSTLDMFGVRDSLRDYAGKVILTSHSPTLASKEIYDSRSKFEKKWFGWMYKKLIKMDEYAFDRADYYIFPSEEAEEPYENNWKQFNALKSKRSQKFYYIPTGISKAQSHVSRGEIRSKYKIPENAFVLSYVGRHNKIKGYDLLKKMGAKLLVQDSTYVLVAGREAPIRGLNNKNWIEIGWTKDPHSLMAASDVFVLPNRETYFDLVLLEALSLGKIVVAANNGGNRYFKKQPGIFLYDSLDQAISILNKLKDMSFAEKRLLEQSNLDLFESKFTLQRFETNYLRTYDTIFQRKEI